MTISTNYAPLAFAGDGITTSFPVSWPYQFNTDIVVNTVVTATQLTTLLVLGSTYSVFPFSNSPAGTGTVTLTVPLPVGTELVISRGIPVTQLTHWVANDPNPTAAIENGLDKLTMAEQGLTYLFNRSWYLPLTGVDGSSYFDARQNRGSNLGDPVQPQDAVNYRFLLTTIAQLNATGSILAPLNYAFTGDGATTAFSIPGATVPFTTGYFVELDGLTQAPTSDYTITLGASPQIIFTTAPPNLVKISVRVLGYAQPILSGINGSAITSGVILPQFLGLGAPSISTFLRGDGNWSNTLVGSTGAVATAGGVVADFQNAGASAIRVASNGLAGVWFAQGGSGNTFDAAWQYDPSAAALGFYGAGAATALSRFFANGNVSLANSALSISYLTGQVNVAGTFFGFNITGNAAGSLITSGQVLPQFLASNFATPGYFLRSDGTWQPGSGGSGGGNTTTTATFVIAAVSSSQTVAVTATTGLTIGSYIYISDGTHTIQGQITGIASLNLTVVTTAITAGAAGNTMANGATVGLGQVPGANSIQVSDAGTSSAAMLTQLLTGKTANVPSGGYQVDLYIASNSGGTATIKGYVNANLPLTQLAATGGISSTDSVPIVSQVDGKFHYQFPSGVGQVLQTNGTTVTFGKINATHVTPNTLTAALLLATNSPANGNVPVYNSGTGGFTWGSSSGGIPTGGGTAQFLRGDGIWSNTLQVTATNTDFRLVDLTGTSTVHMRTAISTLDYFQDSPSGPNDPFTFVGYNSVIIAGLLSGSYTRIDPAPTYPANPVESLFAAGISRFFTGTRIDGGTYWTKITAVNAPAAALTINPINTSWYRLTGFANNVTVTLTDTTAQPTSVVYAGAVTVEVVAPGSFTITWPGTVTWLAGSAPTLSTSGTTLIRLYRRQGQTQWLGEVPAINAGTYTDAQARTAVLQSTYLTNSTSITWNIVGGTSAQPVIATGGVTNSMLAGGIALSQLATTGSASSSTFLRGDGVWSAVSGGSSLPLTTKGDLLGYNTAPARIPVGADGTVLFADSTQTLGTRWGTLPGGTFSPSTAYTWTAGQAFNAANTHAATVLHSVPITGYGSTTVATLGTGGLSDGNLGNPTPIYSHLENNAPSSTAANLCAGTFWHSIYNPGAGQNSLYNIYDVVGNMTNVTPGLANFHLGFTSITTSRQLNKTNGNGTVDTLWFVSNSPDSHYTGGVVDGKGITHSFGAGTVRIGEVNYSNYWGELGLQETRGFARGVLGMEFFCASTVAGPVSGGSNPSQLNGYNCTYAIGIGAGGPGGDGLVPQNWVGMLVDQNAIVPGGYSLRLWGSNGTINNRTNGAGSTATQNAPAAIIKLSGTTQTGLDFAGTAHDSTILTCTNTGAPVITMTDATQSIKLGSVWIRGNGGHLQYSTNGTTWTNIV